MGRCSRTYGAQTSKYDGPQTLHFHMLPVGDGYIGTVQRIVETAKCRFYVGTVRDRCRDCWFLCRDCRDRKVKEDHIHDSNSLTVPTVPTQKPTVPTTVPNSPYTFQTFFSTSLLEYHLVSLNLSPICTSVTLHPKPHLRRFIDSGGRLTVNTVSPSWVGLLH